MQAVDTDAVAAEGETRSLGRNMVRVRELRMPRTEAEVHHKAVKPQICATGKCGYEVERGRKARQIAPKSRKSAFLENTTGSKKWPSKISKGTPSEDRRLLAAEGLQVQERVSATVRTFLLPFKRLQRPIWRDLRAFANRGRGECKTR